MRLGLQYSQGIINGSNARCIALLEVFKQVPEQPGSRGSVLVQECVLYPDCWGCVCGQSSSASCFGLCHGRLLLWHCHCWFESLEQPLSLQAVCQAVQDVCAPACVS